MRMYMAPHEPPERRWLGTAEAAARMGITVHTLYRFIEDGQLTSRRFGRVILIQQGEVDAFIARSRIQPRKSPVVNKRHRTSVGTVEQH